MPLLYYWRPDNYRQDAQFGFGFHLNQNSPAMLKVDPGDGLWAFTRRKDKTYVLAAHLIVKGITYNVPRYRYGKYRLWADQRRSRYFEVDDSPQAESIIRSLSVRAGARHLGQSFQGNAAVRELARGLSPFFGIPSSTLADSPRKTGDCPLHTRKKIVEMYAGKCQVCAYDPRERYDGDICHAHHIVWVSRGGESELDNLCLVCPTHHAAIHMDDAIFDYAGLEYRFSNGLVEPLMINRHLVAV